MSVEGQIVGTVREAWRYPVKSMQGERPASIELTDVGFVGDRVYGLVDRESGRVLSAKTVPELLFASARTEGGAVVITLPDGAEHEAAAAGTSAALAAWLGRDCALRPASEVTGSSYQMTFAPTDDEAELFDIPVAEHTFFDLTPIHLLTTGSLATMAAAHPDGVWDVRRFRPNLLIETPAVVPGAHDGPVPHDAVVPGTPHPLFPEDGWVGTTITVGSASVGVLMAAVRCAMPNRAQPAFERDVEIFRTMNAHHGNHLGIYCESRGAGTVAIGDDVVLAAAAAS